MHAFKLLFHKPRSGIEPLHYAEYLRDDEVKGVSATDVCYLMADDQPVVGNIGFVDDHVTHPAER